MSIHMQYIRNKLSNKLPEPSFLKVDCIYCDLEVQNRTYCWGDKVLSSIPFLACGIVTKKHFKKNHIRTSS